ncbi:MAG TPA: hypothetical protein VN894_00875, partial [Polyangiaceae bacterium]|nr:hypothetical protein [Polyangiaceae bacterium]
VQGVDSGPDVSTPDSTTGTGVDAGADQTTTADVANDQTTADAGSDAAGDAASDSSTASDGDAASDGAACVPFDASGLDDAAVQAGFLAVWQVYKCQGCHQKTSQAVDDAGGGIVLSGNNPGLGDSGLIFPPNLTNDPVTGLGCWTDTQVVNAILQGVDNDGKNLCPSMPKWGTALQLPMDGGPRPGTPMDAGTAQQIVDFLRSLPVVSNMVTQTMCPMPAHDGGSDAAADGGGAEAGNDGGGDTGTVDATADAGDGATE